MDVFVHHVCLAVSLLLPFFLLSFIFPFFYSFYLSFFLFFFLSFFFFFLFSFSFFFLSFFLSYLFFLSIFIFLPFCLSVSLLCLCWLFLSHSFFHSQDLIGFLEKTYCGSVGIELSHLQNLEEVKWLAAAAESAKVWPLYHGGISMRILMISSK